MAQIETALLEAEPIAVDRRHDPEVRRRMSGPAMRTFFNIAKAWGLSVNEQRGLLGWPASSTYHKYKAGNVGTLSYDTLTRISLLLGIYKALHILYPEAELVRTGGSSCPIATPSAAVVRRSLS